MSRRFFPAQFFSAMEIGADNVFVVTADKKENGAVRILGGGEAAVQGLEKGEIVHAGDLAESIAEAAGKAEKSSGLKIGKLYYNLDDAKIESAWSSGSKILDGEGEIQAGDVRAAAQAAERLVGNFEKKVLYSAQIDYVIDEKDPVEDPVGIFGHKLDVKLHLLLVRADRWDTWNRLIRRAGLLKSVPVLSGLSSAFGVLDRNELEERRILWDLAKDYWNGLVMDRGRILEYRTLAHGAGEWEALAGVVPALCQDFQKKYPGIREIVLTGESAANERFLSELKNGTDCPARVASPRDIVKLSEPSHASLAGLLRIAGENESKSVVPRSEKGALTGVQEKMRSFLSDYF